jgi:hypothetical protein
LLNDHSVNHAAHSFKDAASDSPSHREKGHDEDEPKKYHLLSVPTPG